MHQSSKDNARTNPVTGPKTSTPSGLVCGVAHLPPGMSESHWQLLLQPGPPTNIFSPGKLMGRSRQRSERTGELRYKIALVRPPERCMRGQWLPKKRMLRWKLHPRGIPTLARGPSSKCKVWIILAIAYIEIPEENTVMTAKEMALKAGVFELKAPATGTLARGGRVTHRENSHHEKCRQKPWPESRRSDRSDWWQSRYFAPDAAMPMTSWLPRFAEINAKPQTQAGMERPAERNQCWYWCNSLWRRQCASTKAKSTSMMSQSM